MKKKFTKEQIEVIKKYWDKIEKAYEEYTDALNDIEDYLQYELRLDILIHIVNGEPVGVGTWDDEYELLHMPECRYTEEIYDRQKDV